VDEKEDEESWPEMQIRWWDKQLEINRLTLEAMERINRRQMVLLGMVTVQAILLAIWVLLPK
jgi:hypothetical protein